MGRRPRNYITKTQGVGKVTNETIIEKAMERSYEETIIPKEVFEKALNEAREEDNKHKG
jgi:hypothetical protein